MAKWKVTVLINDTSVRNYWDQGANDPATTASDVRDFVRETFTDNHDLDAGDIEVVSAQEVEDQV